MTQEYQHSFFQGDDGLVHVSFGEYTLCGNALDEYTAGDGATNSRTVTCPVCARMVASLHGVRVSREALLDERGLMDLPMRNL